ncbi:MAG: tetratricopeptide repeat protein, partial [Myxococcota bacterium]
IRVTPAGAACLGLVELASGQFEAAVRALQAALMETTPSAPLWRLARGRALLALGRTPEARDELRRVIERAPAAVAAWYTLGRCAEEEGTWDEALEAYATAQNGSAPHPYACAAEVQLALHLGRTERAAAALHRGLVVAPTDPALLRLKVPLAVARGEEPKAIEEMMRAEGPAWLPEELLSLGLLALERGLLEMAEQSARAVMGSAGDDWRGPYLLARVLEAKGAPREEVFNAYEAALDAGDPEGEAGARLGVLLLEGPRADPELALEVLGAARERNPVHGGVVLHLAFAHLSCGEREEALLCVESLQGHQSLSDVESRELENLRALLHSRIDG